MAENGNVVLATAVGAVAGEGIGVDPTRIGNASILDHDAMRVA